MPSQDVVPGLGIGDGTGLDDVDAEVAGDRDDRDVEHSGVLS